MKTLTRSLLATGAAAAMILTSGAAADAAAIPKYKAPKIFGTSFQADPKHDFTKRIRPRHNGVLRGWITYLRGSVAEYEPIKWKKGKVTEGQFVGPAEGDVRAYASPIAKDVVFLSALGCGSKMTSLTVDRRTGLGSKRCSRADLIKRSKDGRRPALITVHQGKIVKLQEIFTP
ncbi:hypothetical protein ACTMTF_23755 [Nonomuraea sp. ZG12]|uniref:hypothetical protein n=1 Tax=Nonomuraea sp. ZG12 TaxID=3452207 RepID=UPI003F8A0797